MTKRFVKKPVVFSKDKFLLPRMEKYTDQATGMEFYFKEISGDSLLSFKELADEIQKANEIQPKQAFDMMAKFIILSACDERGHLIFSDEDLELIRGKNPNTLMDMANIAMPLSGLQFTGLEVEVAVNLKNDLPASSTSD